MQHANDLSYLIGHAQDVENSKISIVAWFARAYRAIGLTGWPPSDPRPAVGHRVGLLQSPLTLRAVHRRAPVYSITSVARSRIDGGTARPSALAVLRFKTISNLVGS